MKKHFIAFSVAALLMMTQHVYADLSKKNVTLQEARESIAQQYILDLQNADYKDISSLFKKDGVVVSTSRGEVNAKDFFYSFLPEVASATTEVHHIFQNKIDKNRIAVRFHFSFNLKDGEKGEGEYIDEFVFAKNSKKLVAVYMFENLKFEQNSIS